MEGAVNATKALNRFTNKHTRQRSATSNRREEEDEDFEKYGLYKHEVEVATQFYKQQIEDRHNSEFEASLRSLSPDVANELRWIRAIEDVDLVVRKMRLFVSAQWIWALFMEIDLNADGLIDQNEFLTMLSKLKGRRPLSRNFYLRTLARKVKQQFQVCFKIFDGDQDGLLDEDGMITAFRHMNPRIDTDSEDFANAMATLEGAWEKMYGVEDFMVLQARVRPMPIQIPSALLSLTDEEYKMYERLYHDWHQAGFPSSPNEFHKGLTQLGLNVALDKIFDAMDGFELDNCRDLGLEQFLYITIMAGAGSIVRPRPILRPGASYEDAFKSGLDLEELWEMGYDCLDSLYQAGWSAQALVKAGMAGAHQLRQVGYNAGELRKCGMSARELKLAGFSLEELRNAGFGNAVLRDCSVMCSKFIMNGTGPSGLVLAPLSENEPTNGGPVKMSSTWSKADVESRWWTTPRIQSMLDKDRPNSRTGRFGTRPSTSPI